MPDSNTILNPYANRRADFTLRPRVGDSSMLRIEDSEGRLIAVVNEGGRSPEQQEIDGRLLSFAGKTHWALGNTCARFTAFGQDLRMLATIVEKDPARAKGIIEHLAREAAKVADVEHKAYEGALLTGAEARAFDAEWNQDGVVPGRPDLFQSPYAAMRSLPVPAASQEPSISHSK